MKATGIVRRIDDLGRIVIPKEIRRNMNILDGDPLEIYLEDNRVIFQKYDTNATAAEYIGKAIDMLEGQDQNVKSMLQIIQSMIKKS